MKKIGIHQPNFLPWKGYFHKMEQCDQFVYLDHVAFSKGSYTNRVKIHLPPNRETWMTIPLKRFSLGTPINEICIDRTQEFEAKMLAQLQQAYAESSNFKIHFAFIENAFSSLKNIDLLSTYNIAWMDIILDKMGITTDVLLSSSMVLHGKKEDLLVDICEQLKATHYISGKGGNKYMNGGAFAQKGITIQFSDFVKYQENQSELASSDLLSKSVVSWLFS